MELHLKIIGVLLIALAILHIGFPRYFKWDAELRPLSLINRQMMQTHTFFLALGLLMIGLLCMTQSAALVNTALGNVLCLGLGVFWAIRLFFQFFIYSSALWRGKIFETAIHVVFSLFWIYMSVVFLGVYFKV